jgi:hypothetical protein
MDLRPDEDRSVISEPANMITQPRFDVSGFVQSPVQ